MIEQQTDRGTTRITARAITRVTATLAASHLDLSPDKVGVTVASPDGQIELTVSAPIPAAAVIDRVEEQIRREASDLVGSPIDRVSVRQSSAPQTAALAGTLATRVRSRYREDPVRLVGLVALGLTSIGVAASVLTRAISRR